MNVGHYIGRDSIMHDKLYALRVSVNGGANRVGNPNESAASCRKTSPRELRVGHAGGGHDENLSQRNSMSVNSVMHGARRSAGRRVHSKTSTITQR